MQLSFHQNLNSNVGLFNTFIHWHMKCVLTYVVCNYFSYINTCANMYIYLHWCMKSLFRYDVVLYAHVCTYIQIPRHTHTYVCVCVCVCADKWSAHLHIMYLFIIAVCTHVTYNYIFSCIDISSLLWHMMYVFIFALFIPVCE